MWNILSSLLWWLFIALIVISLILLVGFYFQGAFRDRVEYQVDCPPNPKDALFAPTLASITNSFITQGIVTDFWAEPDLIQQARLDAVSKAEYTIDFETFFMTPGKRADDFAVAIAERAAAGVKIRLIVDSYGTKDISPKYWQRLQASGIKLSFFNSFKWKAPLDYAGRTHRKLLLIDSQVALVGGAGISDLWDGTEKSDDRQPWLDVEMRLEGDIILYLAGVFSQHWTYGGGKANLNREQQATSVKDKQYPMLVTPGANPQYRFSPIKALKYNSIICATNRIWLASPYFLPDPNSQDLLIAAKQKGLDVRILTTSKRSDKKPVYYASYEHYGKLLRGGVEIYEYQPSMTHAKMLLIDDRWTITGSANFDPRSFDHNEELDLASSQPELVNGTKNVFENGFAQSKIITYSEWKQRSWWRHRILGNLVDFFQWQL
ncbi:cardiolipin synthase B [Waterburya agarophytonicola K14]|uniref:Cardiolipin synthase B n=1 Tax=Waterburya agarophytonicola KI4 TaxID=2874699 RepID=A0A964BXA3_9CYAN|nr:cardiolipin synthase B [Waterburya agarophytonicola]MCC0179738.1 cardiolipin synthase B [Waterburya agarophytonicola KI4]